jgi:glycosyltransferase involved in cell wall biosynthesis
MSELLATLDPARTVVHVHCWTKALSSSVVASIVDSTFPAVMTLHEYFTACPTGCLYLHRDRKVCTLKPMSFACISKDCDSRSYAYKLYRVLRQLVQRSFGRIPNGIREFITVSDFSRRVIEGHLPHQRRVFSLGNPVPAEHDSRVRAEAAGTFVFLGRLSPEKGGALLAEAARIARVKVTFVGDGAEREAILRANPDARITGWLDSAGVTRELREARALVVPSLWYETFGLVALEAAALGIPTVAPEDTAVRDLIVPGATGLVFERGNVASLAAALRALADDALVERLSRGAYDAFWKAPPTMDAHVGHLLATYREVLAAATAPQPAGISLSAQAS